jgi:hypothetical protein
MKRTASVHVLLFAYALVVLLFFGITEAQTESQKLRGLNTEAVGQVEALILINADTDVPIQELRNGSVIDTIIVATSNFNIEARTANGTVGYIRFGHNNISSYNNENGEPFAFCRNNGTDFFACSVLVEGVHTVKATPFFNQTARKPAGKPLQVTFTIITSRSPTYAPISCTRPRVCVNCIEK